MWAACSQGGARPPGHFNFIEEAETGHRSSLIKGLQVQLRLQLSDTSRPGVIT